MPECDVRNEDLIAYEDGYLGGGRRELVDAHLQVRCPSCLQRLAAFREVDEILKATAPSVDARRGQEELRRRLATARPASPSKRSLRPLAVVIGLCLLGVTIWPTASDANSLLGDFVRFGEVQVRRIPGMPAEGVPVKHVATAPADLALAFDGIEPTGLPQDLVPVERAVPNPDRLELLYRNQAGLAILLIQSPAESAALTVGPTSDRTVVQIADTDVLVLRDPRPEAVAAMFWEQDGIIFELMVTESRGGLPLDEATAIVAALIETQDKTSQSDN